MSLFLKYAGVAGLLAGLPSLGWAQTGTFPSIPRYYVGVAAYSSDYQALSGSAYGGTRVPVDATTLSAGVYSLKVQVGGESAITRLVLE